MAYQRARRYPSRLATASSTAGAPVMIDGLEVVDEQAVVLSAPQPRGDRPPRRATLTRRGRSDGLGH